MESNHSIQSRRQILIVLFIVLIIHLLLALFLLIMQYNDKSLEHKRTLLHEQMIEQLKQEYKLKHPDAPEEELLEWVAGQAMPSAPVVFQDEPDITAEQSEEETTENEKDDEKIEDQETEIMKQLTNVQEIKPAESAESAEKASEKIEETKQPEEQTTIKTEVQTTLLEETKPKSSFAKASEDRELHEAFEKTDELKIAQAAAGKKKKVKKITMADIMQGYVQKLNQNSEHYVNSRSNKQGKITEEQIKYERYIARLFACMQKSIRIHKQNIQLPPYQELEVDFYLSLNRNGTLADLYVIKSSGIKALDEFILFIVRDAASSFPPVPSYLNKTSYPLGFIFNPSPEKGHYNFSYL